ncbi:cell division protein FtsQ/DivIB [Proteiniclasticum sp. C24MP]|uniref:cell division protein FtsQ/DivIB n=1 Tax=Proteiniclasticum sp. C24MP TaxID=3374101 RepID=UPI0037540719
MSLKEVQDRIRKKKKKRRRRVMLFLLFLIMISAGIAVTHAPFFDIQSVSVTGNDKIPSPLIERETDKLLGENILLLSMHETEGFFRKQPYFRHMKMKRIFPSTIEITIEEKKAEVNYYKDGVISLATREGVLLEIGANAVDGVTLTDEITLPELGENIYEAYPEKVKILEEFRYLQERNISDIRFTELDLRDMTNIRTYFKDLEVRLGYPDSLKEKLNTAINIISDGNLHGVKGYVDLSYVEKPVVFDETKVIEPTEDDELNEEAPENGDG